MEVAAIKLKKLRLAAQPAISLRRIAERLDMPSSSYAFYEDPQRFKKRYLPVELAKSLVKPLGEGGIDMWDVLALAGLEERADDQQDREADAISDLDLVPISWVNHDYGMGATYAGGDIEVDVRHFPRTFIESITIASPKMLGFARGRGDSMDPTIRDGDLILIDKTQREIEQPDEIWALTIGEDSMIKRLRRRGSQFTILSDNPSVPNDTAHNNEVHIVGRVIFVGRRI